MAVIVADVFEHGIRFRVLEPDANPIIVAGIVD
jgi:hypothetical protein